MHHDKTNHIVQAVLENFLQKDVQHVANLSQGLEVHDLSPLKDVTGILSVSFVLYVQYPWRVKVSSPMGKISFALNVPKIS